MAKRKQRSKENRHAEYLRLKARCPDIGRQRYLKYRTKTLAIYKDKYAEDEAFREKKKSVARAWQKNNKPSYNIRRNALRRDNKRRLVALLGDKCSKCNISYPDCVYDFHHVNPEEKDVAPGTLLDATWSKIIEEISKCVILCANCHRILHFWEH